MEEMLLVSNSQNRNQFRPLKDRKKIDVKMTKSPVNEKEDQNNSLLINSNVDKSLLMDKGAKTGILSNQDLKYNPK